MKQDKINLKQPKYVIPVLALPFIILIAFLIKDMEFGSKEDVFLAETADINTDIPDANLEKRETQSKLGALQSAFKKASDFSSIQNIEKETKDDLADDAGSLYTTEEMRQIDSLNQVTRLREKEMQEQALRYQSQDFLRLQEEADQTAERNPPARSRVDEEMELFKAQMAYLDSLQNPQAYRQTPQAPVPEQRQQPVNVQKPLEVVKAENPATSYFNTVGSNQTDSPITAILDETVQVKEGSRIRIRLLDDILIGKHVLPKSSYLYGNVTGFKAQRVVITVSSVFVNNQRLNVNLTVYDNDGQEGFYIPASSFRELTQNIGGQIQGQSISFEQQAQGVEQFAYGALQDMYRSTTQAVSRTIRQNKAKLKYSTHVYLINNDDNK
jgi:conjugative transposon TraM protein